MRLIDGDELCKKMYHEAFEIDSDEQKWDSGCWIRYKMFERVFESMQPVDSVSVVRCKECKYHTDDEPGAVYCPDRVGGWVDEDFFCKDGDRSIEDGCAVIPGSGSDK